MKSTTHRGVMFGLVVTAGLAATGAIWALANDRSAVIATVNNTCEQVADHEQRIRTVEQQQMTIVTDVGWIRKTMEDERGRPE